MNTAPASAVLRFNSRLWPLLVLGLGLLEAVYPSRTWLTLLILLGGAWLISFLWTRSLAAHLFINREMRYGWAQVGDELEERFTVINDSRLPGLWVEVEDHSNLPGYNAGRVTAIGGGESLSWKTEGVCTRRGLFTLGPTTLRSGDPLGLCSLVLRQPNSTVLLVLPPVLPLPAIEISAGGRAGEGRRPRREALETTVSVDTVREYVAGDPLKAIHWPTSARKNALYVRQFEHTPSSDWWIFLDLQAGVQIGSGQDSTTEHGIVLAASLADRGIRQGHSVGLVTHGRELAWLDPQQSSGHLMSLLRALALVQPGERPLAELLTAAQKSIRYGASLIVITPDVRAGWVPAMLQLVKQGITPTVLLLDPRSFGGEETPQGLLDLLDDHGIVHNQIRRELLDQPEARPGTQGKWEWRVVGRGKAVAVRRPADTSWRQLR
ncbi:MAG TPA: DUF58 domain-containing protein [Anaerolineales bacterium]|nr:DUF58 domain-containing protein [Anaerolineales bacterium]